VADQSHIRRAHINDIGDIYEVIRENPTEVLPRSYRTFSGTSTGSTSTTTVEYRASSPTR